VGPIWTLAVIDIAVAGDFHDGRAVVRSGGRYGYVDKAGKFLIQPQFNAAGDFNDGLALVAVGKRFGFIRKDGKFVINPQFEKARGFQDGLAPVWLAGKTGIHRQTRKIRLESDGLVPRGAAR
jgi:WG containing repeat